MHHSESQSARRPLHLPLESASNTNASGRTHHPRRGRVRLHSIDRVDGAGAGGLGYLTQRRASERPRVLATRPAKRVAGKGKVAFVLCAASARPQLVSLSRRGRCRIGTPGRPACWAPDATGETAVPVHSVQPSNPTRGRNLSLQRSLNPEVMRRRAIPSGASFSGVDRM
jgi:hypothetical protein